MSTVRISGILQTLAPQNVHLFLPSIRQQRKGTGVTARAAYDGAPGMRAIDPQSGGSGGQSSSMSTASTSTDTPPVSYRVSLFGKYFKNFLSVLWRAYSAAFKEFEIIFPNFQIITPLRPSA